MFITKQVFSLAKVQTTFSQQQPGSDDTPSMENNCYAINNKVDLTEISISQPSSIGLIDYSMNKGFFLYYSDLDNLQLLYASDTSLFCYIYNRNL